MSRPTFLDLPFAKEKLSDAQELTMICSAKVRNPVITDREKLLLKQQYPNNNGGTTLRGFYVVCAARTEYRCKKLNDGIFKVEVFAVSNRMDTSRPKDVYFLVAKAVI